MSTALLTILTSKPVVRAYFLYDSISVVSTRKFCDPDTCPSSAHQHFEPVSEQIVTLDDSEWLGLWQYIPAQDTWLGLWQYIPAQDTLPFDESDELEQADDAYAVAVGK